MSGQEITQRDLRRRATEILHSVEQGQSFIVIRNGHPIGQLIPLPHQPRFVSRERFLAGSSDVTAVDPDRWRTDLDAVIDSAGTEPYQR